MILDTDKALEYPENDSVFHDHVLKEVTKYEDETGWSVSTTESAGFGIPNEGIIPKVGDSVRIYGGFGHIIRGIFVNGRKVYYRTEEEQRAKGKLDSEETDRKKRKEYAQNKIGFDRRIEALPPAFRERILGFRERNPDFGHNYESYELFCCEQAVILAGHLYTREAFEEFKELPWDEQMKRVPELDDGHSGNTFGCTIRLAYLFCSEPAEVLYKMHGAMCPLAGCEDYGCWSASEEARKLREDGDDS